jgi:hypothetical protein
VSISFGRDVRAIVGAINPPRFVGLVALESAFAVAKHLGARIFRGRDMGAGPITASGGEQLAYAMSVGN